MSVIVSQPLCAVLLGVLLGATNIAVSSESNQSSGYGTTGRSHSVVLQTRGRS